MHVTCRSLLIYSGSSISSFRAFHSELSESNKASPMRGLVLVREARDKYSNLYRRHSNLYFFTSLRCESKASHIPNFTISITSVVSWLLLHCIPEYAPRGCVWRC